MLNLRRMSVTTRALLGIALTLATASAPILASSSDARASVSVTSLPEGTAVREHNSFAIFQMVGGAKVPFVSADEFYALGYTLDRVVVVAPGELSAVAGVPAPGTLLRERNSFAVFIMDNGKRRWITTREIFDAAGYTLAEVKVVATGALASIPAGPDLAAQSLDATATAAAARCGPNSRLFGYAQSERDGNWVGNRMYYLTVASKLYSCGGYVYAYHIIYIDSRWLPLGTELFIRVSTKRSDGRWVYVEKSVDVSKNFESFTFTQYRGVGGRLRLTDVHVKHFAMPSQTSIFPSSTAKAKYGMWNGPEAKPAN